MRLMKLLGVALGAVLALAMVVPAAHADPANQMTRVTINAPFQIPGHKVLAAGTYWFKLMDSTRIPRNIVEIYNPSRTEVLATVVTRPTYRNQSQDSSDTELQFATSSRQPMVLVRWFYPGRLAGHTMIYSHPTERRIHRENMETVFAPTAPAMG